MKAMATESSRHQNHNSLWVVCHRDRMYSDLPHKRALHADIWRAEGADEISPSDIWTSNGWGKQTDRSTEAVQRWVHARSWGWCKVYFLLKDTSTLFLIKEIKVPLSSNRSWNISVNFVVVFYVIAFQLVVCVPLVVRGVSSGGLRGYWILFIS